MAKVRKVVQKWTGSIRKRPNGTYYVGMPAAVIRAFVRKLPREAFGMDGIIVDVSVTWEGLADD